MTIPLPHVPTRVTLSLLLATMSGCGGPALVQAHGGEGGEPIVRGPAPHFEEETLDDSPAVAGWIEARLRDRARTMFVVPDLDTGPPLQDDRWTAGPWQTAIPQTATPETEIPRQADPETCLRMPTAGLATPSTRRRFDLDSIRKLPPAVFDSLSAEDALPRLDGEVIIRDRSRRVTRMPTVRLDSVGYPIRVAPLCADPVRR